MRFRKFIENPVVDAELIGNWSNFPNKKQHQGWDKASFNILNNNGIEKIKNIWANTKNTFDLYFVKQSGMKNLTVGIISQEELQKLNINISPNPDRITVIFVNNIGADRMPMTPWTAAHRFGHTLFSLPEFQKFRTLFIQDIRTIIQQIYHLFNNRNISEKIILAIMNSIGKMRSAREKKIDRMNEFFFEIVAQYITSGKVTFNISLPNIIKSKDFYLQSYANQDEIVKNEIELLIGHMGNYAERDLQKIFNNCVGKIFMI